MKRTYASTRLRLYPHPDVESRLLRPSIMHNADDVSVRNTDDAPGTISCTNRDVRSYQRKDSGSRADEKEYPR